MPCPDDCSVKSTFWSFAEDNGKHSKRRGSPKEGSPAPEGVAAEDAAPQNKRSRTGRAIVPPAAREEAPTPAPAAHPGRVKGRGAGDAAIASATPEEAAQAAEAQQKGRRKGRKSTRRIEWPPAATEQLAAAQKVRHHCASLDHQDRHSHSHAVLTGPDMESVTCVDSSPADARLWPCTYLGSTGAAAGQR